MSGIDKNSMLSVYLKEEKINTHSIPERKDERVIPLDISDNIVYDRKFWNLEVGEEKFRAVVCV